MAKRTKTQDTIDPNANQPVLNNPFASLGGLRAALPQGDTPQDDFKPSSGHDKTFAPKVVLSFERKGRGGKTVTVLRGVLLAGKPRDQFMRELRKALGTSVREENEDIVMGGDQRERAKPWLEARGAKNVVTSG